MSVLRLGLIGAGSWGRRYIHTLNGMAEATLSKLASRNPESRGLVAAECTITPDWREVAGDESLDGVIIATPPVLHAEMAEVAIAAGVPVLIEKPMTLSVNEAQQLVRMSGEAGCLVMVGHTHLFSSAFRTLKARVATLGVVSGLRSTGGNWGPCRPDTPMLWDWAPHDISMCLDLVGHYPVAIHAQRVGADALTEGEGEAIDVALEFPEGIHAAIRVSNIDRKKSRWFEVCCADGRIVYDDLSAEKLGLFPKYSVVPSAIPIDSSMPLTNLVAEFCSAINAGQVHHSSLDLGLQVIKILDCCQRSLDLTKSALLSSGSQ